MPTGRRCVQRPLPLIRHRNSRPPRLTMPGRSFHSQRWRGERPRCRAGWLAVRPSVARDGLGGAAEVSLGIGEGRDGVGAQPHGRAIPRLVAPCGGLGGGKGLVRQVAEGGEGMVYCASGGSFIYSRRAPIACARGYGVGLSRKEFLHNASLAATSPSLPGRLSAPGIERGRFGSPIAAASLQHSPPPRRRLRCADAVAADPSTMRALRWRAAHGTPVAVSPGIAPSLGTTSVSSDVESRLVGDRRERRVAVNLLKFRDSNFTR